jgi:hypothetical protein
MRHSNFIQMMLLRYGEVLNFFQTFRIATTLLIRRSSYNFQEKLIVEYW